jgi:hypothetical protein
MPGRTHSIASILFLTLALTACGSDSSPAGPGVTDATVPEPSIYDDDTKWLCRPGLAANPCLETLPITDVHADGTTTVSELPKTPESVTTDCFYLYPTLDPGLFVPPRNLEFDQIDKGAARDVLFAQGVAFRELCALWAPLYRQASLNSFEQADTRERGLEAAYRDLEAAFDYYLQHAGSHRPIVFVTHSQGAIVTTRLLQRRFEGHPALLERLVVAVLAGPLGGFTVPDGKTVGGTFEEIPLCTADAQNGCALTHDTFGPAIQPGDTYTAPNGGVPAGFDTGCTSPPGGPDGAPARLNGALFRAPTGPLAALAPQLDYGGAVVDTAYARYSDFYTARCARSSGGLSYLQIAAEPLPGDVRVDPVPYTHAALGDPGLGLHALDYAFVSGDLVRAVRTKSSAHGK